MSTTTSKHTASNYKAALTDTSEQVLSIIQRAETLPKKQPFIPKKLDPIIRTKSTTKIGTA